MKCRLVLFLAISFAVGMAPAVPRGAVLYVQNRCSGETQPPLGQLSQWLANAISAHSGDIAVIMPDHAIADFNVTDREISVKALGENLMGAEGVLVASVQRFSRKKIPGFEGESKYRLSVGMTLTLYDSEGKSVPSATASFGTGDGYSKTYPESDMTADVVLLYEEFLEEASGKLAAKFLHSFNPGKWPAVARPKLNVFFDCNVLGADVQVDGLSYGTTPAQLELTPGVHDLLVSYPPYYREYRRRAVFNQKGQRHNVVLQLTEKGEAERDRALEYAKKLYELHALKKKDAFEYDKKKRLLDAEIAERAPLLKMRQEMIDAVIERYIESGRVTDEVRVITAEGIAKYNGQSYQRVNITDGEMDGAGVSSPAAGADDVVEPPNWSGIEKWVMKYLGM